jgi:hypothetical protein
VLAVVEQPARPGEPAATARLLTPEQQAERQPERAPGGPDGVAEAQALVMRTLPHGGAVVVTASQVGGGREPLEVGGLQRRLAVRGRQRVEGLRPRPPRE